MSAVSSSSTSSPIDTIRSRPSPTGTSLGAILPLPSAVFAPASRPFTPSMRDREAPDVGVEDADGEAARRERGREVRGDRRLADAALAAADRDHAGRRRHLGGGRRLRRAQARLLHQRRALLLGHLVVLDPDLADAGQPGDLGAHVGADLAPERAGRGREGDLDHDVAVRVDPDVVDHPQIDDRGPQLGVEDPGQDTTDVVGVGNGRRGNAGAAGKRGAGSSGVSFVMEPIKPVKALKICPIAKYRQGNGSSGRLESPRRRDALLDVSGARRFHDRALTATELADRLGLHANTVRLHLERLREAGLVDVEPVHRGTVGRPQHVYSLAAGAPGLGLDPPSYTLLAGMLAMLAERVGAEAADATAAGRSWGVEAGGGPIRSRA